MDTLSDVGMLTEDLGERSNLLRDAMGDVEAVSRALRSWRGGAAVVAGRIPEGVVNGVLGAVQAGLSAVPTSAWALHRARKALGALELTAGSAIELRLSSGAVTFHMIREREWTTAGGRERDVVFCTSGTTATPKLVPFSVPQVRFILSALQERLSIRPDDHIGSAFQAAFDYGFYQPLLAMRAGARFTSFDGLRFPQDAISVLRRGEVTIVPLTPAYGAKIIEQSNLQGLTFPAVRLVTSTGAQLTKATASGVGYVFPNAVTLPMYGLTECKRVSIPENNGANLPDGSVGTALPGTSVVIVDPFGDEVEAGTRGEAVVSGPHVSRGYIGGSPWRGKLRTGDLMSMDRAGHLFHHGRITQDQMKIADETISLAEIREIADQFGNNELVEVALDRNAALVRVRFATNGINVRAFRERISIEISRKVQDHLSIEQGARLSVNSNGKVETNGD